MNERNIWNHMKRRCLNPKDSNFKYYGGRGITVCERWRTSYLAFLEDMGPRPSRKHSIDRINNDGNYEPGNCRWATHMEQVMNTRHIPMLGDRNGMRVHPESRPIGSRNGRSKVSEEQAREIVARMNSGEMRASVAAAFGLDPSTISKITGGKRWCRALEENP